MDDATNTSETAQDKLIRDFRAIVSDTEELLKATAGLTGEQIAVTRAKLEERVAVTRKRFADMEDGLTEQAKAAYDATDKLVRAHPWPAVGAAAAIGFLIGLLTSRRG